MEQPIHDSHDPTLTNEKALALIRKIEAGDKSSLIALYDATSRLVFGLTLKILGDRALAEETLLDVFTRIWKQSIGYEPQVPPLDWVVALARTSAVARLHWSKRDSRKPESTADSVASPMTVAPEQQKTARSSLDSLAPAHRELLEQAYFGGMSCNEMAVQAGKPLGAVKSQIRIGLGELGERLGSRRPGVK